MILFLGSLLSDTLGIQGLYMYGCSFVNSDKYWIHHLKFHFLQSHYFHLLKHFFQVQTLKFLWWNWLCPQNLLSKLLSLLDILYKKAFSTIVFLNGMTCFSQFSLRNSWKRSLATSDLFLCLHNQFLYILLSDNKEYKCAKYYHSWKKQKSFVASFGISARFIAKF